MSVSIQHHTTERRQEPTLQEPTHTTDALHHAATIDYKYELVRKGIHLSSLSIPLIYSFISKELALAILVPLTGAFLVVDLARYYFPPVSAWFYRWFGWLLRHHEQDSSRKRLNGATNVMIAATLCVLIFPKFITITALAVLVLADSTSALVGRRCGKRPFFAKSAEGALAFFVAGVLVILVTPKPEGLPLEYAFGIVAVAIATIVESLPTRIDDNISVPLTIGFVLWGLYTLLLPTVDLYRFI
jgi:dolichol kinase